MRRHHSIAFLLAIMIALFATTSVSAHRPATAAAEGTTVIPDPSTSYAYYAALENGGDVDIYTFSAEAGQFFHAGINIPQIAGLESYGVSLALLGPGLPAVSSDALPALPHEHSTDAGDHSHDDAAGWRERLGLNSLTGIVAASVDSDDFFEPFTQTNYWGRQTIQLDLPATGTYTLLVWHPQGVTGKYVMDTGRAEVFSLGDLFRFPIWWVQTHIYFEHTAGLVTGAMGLLLLMIGIVTVPRWLSRQSILRRQESPA
jgi:hypothetical protein